MVCKGKTPLQFPKIYWIMKKDQQKTIKDFSIVELDATAQKHVKGGEDEIVTEEDVVN